MSILFVLIPLGLVLLGVAVWGFIWAVNNNQFEDLDQAAHSILFDDVPTELGASDESESARRPLSDAVDKASETDAGVGKTPL
jgi:cbb3-type cytochrome oxidase maturation protein